MLGEGKKLTFSVTNKGNVDLSVDVSARNIGIVSVEKNSFDLGIGATEPVTLLIIAETPGVFTGEIVVKAGGIQKLIPIIIEVETANALFDIGLDIPAANRVLSQEDELITQINLFEVARVGILDVTVNYIIKDLKDNIIMQESETFAVDRQKQYVKKFKLPADIAPGKYVVAAELVYESGVAISSSLFEVVKAQKAIDKILGNKKLLYSLLLILLGMIYLFAMPLLPIKIKQFKRFK